MSAKARRVTDAAVEPLTRSELDRRIQDLITEVAAPTDDGIGHGASAEGFRWIEPADLVRRVRPYLSRN